MDYTIGVTDIVLIAHNLRSSHNVGSLLRTAEGLGVTRVFLTGYSPYPSLEDDDRLPHIARKVNDQIVKTALGAEKLVDWRHQAEVGAVITGLRKQGYAIAGLEQTPKSTPLPGYQPPDRIALIVGREVEGIEPEVIVECDIVLEIPMFGGKESFNVVQATAMALYHFRFAR
jgi:23S rRNA (guanosine2251-2'-O)-methyltransferase